MTVEEYFEEWWTPKELPENGFNKTAMLDFAEMYHKQVLSIHDVVGSLRFSEREVDFAYLCGVFNTSGIDGLHTEIQRLKELGKEPHDIIEACRKQ